MSSFQEKIIVAIDIASEKEAIALFQSLRGKAKFVKIGMELYYSVGPSIIKEAKNYGFNIFLDLKLHDIPTTVKKALQSISALGVDIVNVHAAGGIEMMKAAKQAFESQAKRPLLIAVTQLTSTDQTMMNEQLLIPGTVDDVVFKYAQLAHQAGLDGVVSSAHEVENIKKRCGQNFITVTPGIRPLGANTQDQKRVTTPAEALLKMKSDYIVIGRPITEATDPGLAFHQILEELK